MAKIINFPFDKKIGRFCMVNNFEELFKQAIRSKKRLLEEKKSQVALTLEKISEKVFFQE